MKKNKLIMIINAINNLMFPPDANLGNFLCHPLKDCYSN